MTNAFIGKDGQPSKMIKFSKEINGIQHVVVATPENKYKKLWVVSEYIEQKNKDTSQSSHGDVALPPTPQANSDNVSSTNSIPQKKENTTNVEKKTQNNDSDNGIKVMDDGSVKYSISTKDTDGNDLSIEQQCIAELQMTSLFSTQCCKVAKTVCKKAMGFTSQTQKE